MVIIEPSPGSYTAIVIMHDPLQSFSVAVRQVMHGLRIIIRYFQFLLKIVLISQPEVIVMSRNPLYSTLFSIRSSSPLRLSRDEHQNRHQLHHPSHAPSRTYLERDQPLL